MDLTAYFPARRQHGLITWRQLHDAGMQPAEIQHLVRDRSLVRIRRGIYTARETWDGADEFRARPLLRLHAARLTIGKEHVLSHDSAALLLGLGLPDPRTALVHVTRPRVLGARHETGIKHHRAAYAETDVVEIEGVRLLGPARTACDMAREHGSTHGTAACSAALRMGVTKSELHDVAARMHYWRGVTQVRRAIDLATPWAESYLEGLALDLIADLGLGRPEPQFGLGDGMRTAYADFRIGRHLFECEGKEKLSYVDDPLSPADRAWEQKKRYDFLTGFKLGLSRIVMHDCLEGRDAALRRLSREYADTQARFGDDISDLTAYRMQRRRPTG